MNDSLSDLCSPGDVIVLKLWSQVKKFAKRRTFDNVGRPGEEVSMVEATTKCTNRVIYNDEIH